MKQYQSVLKAGVALLMFCFLLSGFARSADETDERILFLTLRFDKTSVHLISSRIVPGHLKTNRGPSRGEIQYELLGESGVMLQGAITNPLVQRFEYEDPDNPGKLLSKTVNWTEATVNLRVPYSAAIKELTFYREQSSGSPDIKSTRSVIGVVELTTVHRGER